MRGFGDFTRSANLFLSPEICSKNLARIGQMVDSLVRRSGQASIGWLIGVFGMPQNGGTKDSPSRSRPFPIEHAHADLVTATDHERCARRRAKVLHSRGGIVGAGGGKELSRARDSVRLLG